MDSSHSKAVTVEVALLGSRFADELFRSCVVSPWAGFARVSCFPPLLGECVFISRFMYSCNS